MNRNLFLILFFFSSPILANPIVENNLTDILNYLSSSLSRSINYDDYGELEFDVRDIEDYQMKKIKKGLYLVSGHVGMGHEYDESSIFSEKFEILIQKKGEQLEIRSPHEQDKDEIVQKNIDRLYSYLENRYSKTSNEYNEAPRLDELEFTTRKSGKNSIVIRGSVGIGYDLDESIVRYQNFKVRLVRLENTETWNIDYKVSDIHAILRSQILETEAVLKRSNKFYDMASRHWVPKLIKESPITSIVVANSENLAFSKQRIEVSYFYENSKGERSPVEKQRMLVKLSNGKPQVLGVIRNCSFTAK